LRLRNEDFYHFILIKTLKSGGCRRDEHAKQGANVNGKQSGLLEFET